MMIQQKLEEWIKYPERLDKDSLYELRRLLAKYPYFQTAWVLYLKNLYLVHDSSFKEELRRGVLYVADLSVLFYSIEGEWFRIEKHEREKETGGDGTADRTLDLIDRFLSDSPDPVTEKLPLPDSVAVDYTSVLLQENAEEISDSVIPLHHQELIDNFIERSGEVGNRVSEEVGEDVLLSTDVPEKGKEEEGEENYFTETLAKIYVRQQRYDKALEIIKKLNLKYQKKNTYFADQIRFLEKLIINAKSK